MKYGNGNGDGDGDGYGNGNGNGNGYGNGNGDGNGNGYGSLHAPMPQDDGQIRVGCQVHSVAHWRANGREIARANSVPDHDFRFFEATFLL